MRELPGRRRAWIALLVPALLAGAGPLRAAAMERDPAEPTVCAPPCPDGKICVGQRCVGAAPVETDRAADQPPPPPGSAPTSGPQADQPPGPAPTSANAPSPEPVRQPPAAPPPRPPALTPPLPPPETPAARRRQKRGFFALPFVGMHSYQHAEATGHGAGLRVGTLVGGRVSDNVALARELTFDRSNVSGVSPDYTTREWAFETAFSPLFRVPRGSLEITFGPKLGAFLVNTENLTSRRQSVGYVFGANAGLFVPVSPTTSFGALLSYALRHGTETCPTFAGDIVSCRPFRTSGFAQVLGLTAAAMF